MSRRKSMLAHVPLILLSACVADMPEGSEGPYERELEQQPVEAASDPDEMPGEDDNPGGKLIEIPSDQPDGPRAVPGTGDLTTFKLCQDRDDPAWQNVEK